MRTIVSKVFGLVVLVFSLFVFSSLSAQVVDPCQYGCPKEGCPQCDDGGGPIEDENDDDDSDDESD